MSTLPSVSAYMDKSFTTLSPDMDVYKAINILIDKGITSAVVVDKQNHILGILSEKDCMTLLCKGAYHSLPGGQVKDYMTAHVVTIPPSTDIFTVASMFLKHFFRRLVIADEENHILGQITRRDLLRVIKEWKKEEKNVKIAPIM
ncbi:MAG TPA: CBS domain-containing protein [Caldithrix abyssi]|uniref:CBS domain-containing protein n=1 Tax=Caldithrix abyssi TaxID=187145 RepID=A0A7V1LN69_CALAY|nr:CBS domain-containing protein [Caldithrix abyssi]